MMVKKGITEKNLEESKVRMAQQGQDLVKCAKCGRFYSKKSAAETGNVCPHCGN
jgi:acetyl-CoA carboxylase beta subunit